MNAPEASSRPLGSVLMISEHRLLGPALLAALTALGWLVSWRYDWPSEPVEPQDELARHLVLVADSEGALPAAPAMPTPAGLAHLAVGSRGRLAELTRAVAAGAHQALDADQPFTELARRLHESLLNPFSPAQAAQSALRLEARAAAAARFDALTRRERQVLVALAQGLPAARIAEREHLSLATVRSHIQSILVKLNASSQLAAVALTHGACGEAEVLGRLRELHQF